jgi:hypothetical protein
MLHEAKFFSTTSERNFWARWPVGDWSYTWKYSVILNMIDGDRPKLKKKSVFFHHSFSALFFCLNHLFRTYKWHNTTSRCIRVWIFSSVEFQSALDQFQYYWIFQGVNKRWIFHCVKFHYLNKKIFLLPEGLYVSHHVFFLSIQCFRNHHKHPKSW